MPMISAIRARDISIPLDAATAFSSRLVTQRHYGIVELEASDGFTGIGFCYVGSAGGTLFSEIVTSLLAPLLRGQDPFRVEGLWGEMYQEALLQGRAGTVMRAISALDTALWDHNARAVDLPLWRFLGAVHADSVPAYASGGYYLPDKTPELLADEMEGYVRLGYGAVKMKVGKLDFRAEEARIAAVRERIGPDPILMLDANNAWADVASALPLVRMYERYNPYFIEEPFGPDDIDNHARLALRTPVPIATGEIEADGAHDIGSIQRIGVRQSLDIGFGVGTRAGAGDRHVHAERDGQRHGSRGAGVRHAAEGEQERLTRFDPRPESGHEICAGLRCGARLTVCPEQSIQSFVVVAAHRIHILPLYYNRPLCHNRRLAGSFLLPCRAKSFQNPLARPEKPDLKSIFVDFINLFKLFQRKPFHFL